MWINICIFFLRKIFVWEVQKKKIKLKKGIGARKEPGHKIMCTRGRKARSKDTKGHTPFLFTNCGSGFFSQLQHCITLHDMQCRNLHCDSLTLIWQLTYHIQLSPIEQSTAGWQLLGAFETLRACLTKSSSYVSNCFEFRTFCFTSR